MMFAVHDAQTYHTDTLSHTNIHVFVFEYIEVNLTVTITAFHTNN